MAKKKNNLKTLWNKVKNALSGSSNSKKTSSSSKKTNRELSTYSPKELSDYNKKKQASSSSSKKTTSSKKSNNKTTKSSVKTRTSSEYSSVNNKDSSRRLLPEIETKTKTASLINTMDIAPVKKKEDGEGFFKKAKAFEDGYDFGDVTKTAGSTVGDLGVGAMKGVGRLGEGLRDALYYGVSEVADVVGADKFADKVKVKAQENSIDNFFKDVEKGVEEYSVFGKGADPYQEALGQIGAVILTGGIGAGAGLGTAGVTALTTGTFGVSGLGSGMSEAYQSGATDKEALAYGTIKGTVDAGTELLFGGLGKTVGAIGLSRGISSLDDAFALKLSNKISNQFAKNLAEYGVKATAEGSEEVLAGIGSAIGKKLTYMEDEELEDLIKDENLLESFLVGTVTSGIAQSGLIPGTTGGSLKEANETGRDFITGYTQNEQSVVDKVVENRIKEEESSGKKLSNKDITKIKEEVETDLKKGYIDIDTIESTLGGETYKNYKSAEESEAKLKKEYESLNKLKQFEMTGEQIDRRAELKTQLDEMKTKSEKSRLREQLDFEIGKTTEKDTFLRESYNEKSRRGQAYKADLNKYDAKQQEIIKKATESGILNNTNRTHEFVDMVAKISADKGVSFDFTSNEKLKESGFAIDGKTINGYIKDGNIAVNINSNKALNTVVGHEITHVLEGTELYTELQNAVKEYATTKGEYDTRYKALQGLYKDVDSAVLDNEVTADLIGDYLFTDSNFVNKLSAEKPNVFKKIYDEIKYLVKTVTGTKESRELAKVQKLFEDAYKTSKNTKSDATKYSVSEDIEGRQLSEKQKEYFKDSKIVDENGNLKVMYHGTEKGGFHEFIPGFSDDETSFFFTDNNETAKSYSGTHENYVAQTLRTADDFNKFFASVNADDYEVREENGQFVLYEDGDEVATSDTADGIYEEFRDWTGLGYGSSNYKVYLNLKNPLVVDAKRNNWDEVSSEFSQELYDRYQTLTTDEKEALTSIAEWDDMGVFRDEINGAVAKVERGTKEEYARNLASAYEKLGGEDVNMYRLFDVAMDDFSEESVRANSLKYLTTRDYAKRGKEQGYDGVIFKNIVDNGLYASGMERFTPSTVAIAFDSNQIKSVDNKQPTSDADIRYSLSDDYAPLTEAQANERDAQQRDRLFALNENDMPPEMDAPYYEELDTEPVNPFDERDIDDVGKRNVKAYMYENPEVKPYFQEEAQIMLRELQDSTKGEKQFNSQLYYETGGEQGWFGTKRQTSEEVAYLLDKYKYTYADIEKGLKAIIEDHGAENNAISKRIEFMLDERLRDGYTDFQTGYEIPSNQEYIDMLKNKNVTEYSDEAYNSWLQSLANEEPMDDISPVKSESIKPQPEVLEGEEAEMASNPIVRADSKETGGKTKQRKWVKTSTESEVVNKKIVPEDLDQSAINYQPIHNKKTLGVANSRLDSMGYDTAVSYFKGQFTNRDVKLEDVALGERLIQEAMKREDYDTARELIQDVSILGTELGQKVQALSIIQRLTPEGQLRTIRRTIERARTKGDKAFEGVELTPEMEEKILRTRKKDGTFDQKELDSAVEDVKQELANQMKVTAGEKINAWRYLSMLGNPKTHIRNIVSNIAMKGTLSVKNAMARTVEEIAPIKNRTKTWKSSSEDVKAYAKEMAQEYRNMVADGNKYNDSTGIKAKRDVFKNKILNNMYEFNSDMLQKEDWWFSKSAFEKSFREYLTANGIETKKDIVDKVEIVNKAKAYATEQAQIATFQQYSWLANKIGEIERKNALTNMAVGAVVPFKKTPINIAKTGLNYSPLGFAKTLTHDIAEVKKGNMEASTLVDHLAQNTTGTALTLVGYMLAMSGLLNGSGDDDKEGTYDYQLGKQSYSINIGDSSFSLSWLTPVAMPLFVGANAYEQLVEGQEWNGDVVVETLAQTLDPLSEMSFLSSLDSVLSSYDSGIQKFAGIGETMFQNYATQFIPTLSSQLAGTIDDTKRSTKVSGDSGFKMFDETVNKLKYKIPGLRETLEPTTDIWGNEVKQTENIFGRALENFIAPYSRKDYIATEIDEELKDLYAQTGEDDLLPTIPYNYLNYNGEKYKMSAKEHTEYKKDYGQTANETLEDLFRTSTYKNASSEERAEMVDHVYDYARDEANRRYLAGKNVEYTNATKDKVEYYRPDAIETVIRDDIPLDEANFKIKNPEKYDFFNQYNITYSQYKASKQDDSTSRMYDWAFENQEYFQVSRAISTDLPTYWKHNDYMWNNIRADKDEYGKSISGSKKKKIIEYINNIDDLEYEEKLVLFKKYYPADDTYNYEIIDYLNSRDDITYEQMETILKELDFKVDSQGNITW